MALSKELASIKRFGPRYGRTVKHKVGMVENMRRKSTKCPYCNYDAVSRLSAGIWQCKKCNSKFAGKAYTFSKKKSIKEIEAEIEEAEEVEEQQEEKKEESEE
jgi:large subunit ribosomal protein L37Ae